jgi:hypothetical protein
MLENNTTRVKTRSAEGSAAGFKIGQMAGRQDTKRCKSIRKYFSAYLNIISDKH